MRAVPLDGRAFDARLEPRRRVDGLREQIQRFIEVGASKFVPILGGEPEDWFAELEGVANAVLPLQN